MERQDDLNTLFLDQYTYWLSTGSIGLATVSTHDDSRDLRHRILVMPLGAKRCFDFFVALVGIIALAPLIIVLTACVLAFDGSPAYFTHLRPGIGGRPFRILKFRSMSQALGPDGASLPDEARLTRFGRFLRATSLDELPELYNVLIGDMSLVGPRPLLVEYLPLYTPAQSRRHEVRPGITGWAQINGRNKLSWEERFALDVWYVDNRNFRLDLKILWLTLRKVWVREGITHSGVATMPKFTGSER